MLELVLAHASSIIGCIFLINGAVLFCSQYIFLKKAIRCVGHFKGWAQDAEYLWKPIVVFQTTAGKEIEFTSSVGTNPRPNWECNRPVDVLYDPVKPEKAQIYTALYFWLMPALFLSFGLIAVFCT